MKFCKWQHPKTGQTRIYVNGAFGFGVKAYAVDGGDTGNYRAGYPELVIKCEAGMSVSDEDRIKDMIDEYVKQAVPSDVCPTFSDYLSLAK